MNPKTAFSIEQQYVLYSAATNSLLLDLLLDWTPWRPDRERADLEVEVPRLAQAIVDMVDLGFVEVMQSDTGTDEYGLVPKADVPVLVNDAENWFGVNPLNTTFHLHITAEAGMVQVPPART